MAQLNLSLPDNYRQKFDEIADKTKLLKSELLRRWIDEKHAKLSPALEG